MRQALRFTLAAVSFIVAACGGAAGPGTTSPTAGAARAAVIRGTRSIPASWTVRSSPVTASKAMVVSAHPLASAAGMEIIKQGGNAIDAAVAVGFALAVVLPDAGNIGGGGFIVHRSAAGDVQAIDYREMAPGGASHDMYLDSAGNLTEKSVTGHLASGVPGSVAGMYEAWKRHGSLPWATLLAPAIRLAQDGHRVDSE
ncbi:MAG TPA: gamma-glutamyltransferase, partial [Gemmatimonadales bacterium]|nr:gamma-glutamyltransferase [Gemmatimonadales bacterium]